MQNSVSDFFVLSIVGILNLCFEMIYRGSTNAYVVFLIHLMNIIR
jgi:hypothetical protein